MSSSNHNIEELLTETWHETIELRSEMENVTYILDKANHQCNFKLITCEYRPLVEACHSAKNGAYKCSENLRKIMFLGYDVSNLAKANNTYMKLSVDINMLIPKIKNARNQNKAELDEAEKCSYEIVNLIYALEGIIGKMCGSRKSA